MKSTYVLIILLIYFFDFFKIPVSNFMELIKSLKSNFDNPLLFFVSNQGHTDANRLTHIMHKVQILCG